MVRHFSYVHVILLIAVAALAVRLYLNFPLAYNQSLYHYQGLVMLNGGLPYADFIEKKGPMGLLTYGLAAIIFDSSAFSYRLFDLLLQSITGFMLYLTLRRKYPVWLSVMAPVIWFSHTLIDGPGNTADVTNIITLNLVSTLYLLSGSIGKRTHWAVGILMGLACWVKPTAFLAFLPVWYYVYTAQKDEGNSTIYQSFLKVLGGLTIVSSLFVLYLLISSSWKGFWEALVLDPLLNYVDGRSRISWRVLKRIVYIMVQDPILRITGAVGLLFFVRNRITKMSLLFCCSVFLMIMVEGKHFPYHFSPMWPLLTIGAHHLLYLAIEKIRNQYRLKVALIAAIIILLSYPLITIGNRFVNAGFLSTQYFDPGQTFLLQDFKEMYYGRQEMVAYLKNNLKKGDTLFVLGSDPHIYLDLRKPTQCRFAREGFMLSLDNTPEYLHGWQNELMDYMKVEIPDWLVVENKVRPVMVEGYKREMDELLKLKYDEGKVLGLYTLYHKN